MNFIFNFRYCIVFYLIMGYHISCLYNTDIQNLRQVVGGLKAFKTLIKAFIAAAFDAAVANPVSISVIFIPPSAIA